VPDRSLQRGLHHVQQRHLQLTHNLPSCLAHAAVPLMINGQEARGAPAALAADGRWGQGRIGRAVSHRTQGTDEDGAKYPPYARQSRSLSLSNEPCRSEHSVVPCQLSRLPDSKGLEPALTPASARTGGFELAGVPAGQRGSPAAGDGRWAPGELRAARCGLVFDPRAKIVDVCVRRVRR